MSRSVGSIVDPSLAFATSFDPGDGLRPLYNTLGALTPVWPRPRPNERALAIICTGQSTIANWGAGGLHTATSPRSLQLNVIDGLVYPAASPALGADGTDNSPASAIGDFLIDDDVYDRVVVANVAFGSTSALQWADGTNNLALGLKIAWQRLKAHGYTTIRLIHQQGEYDANAGTSQANMLTRIQTLDAWRRAYGINCPMYVSRTTFSYDWTTTDPDPLNWTPGAAAQAIRAAQVAAVNGATIFAGPDTDTVRGPLYRNSAHYDTQAGAIAVAQLWADTLAAAA